MDHPHLSPARGERVIPGPEDGVRAIHRGLDGYRLPHRHPDPLEVEDADEGRDRHERRQGLPPAQDDQRDHAEPRIILQPGRRPEQRAARQVGPVPARRLSSQAEAMIGTITSGSAWPLSTANTAGELNSTAATIAAGGIEPSPSSRRVRHARQGPGRQDQRQRPCQTAAAVPSRSRPPRRRAGPASADTDRSADRVVGVVVGVDPRGLEPRHVVDVDLEITRQEGQRGRPGHHPDGQPIPADARDPPPHPEPDQAERQGRHQDRTPAPSPEGVGAPRSGRSRWRMPLRRRLSSIPSRSDPRMRALRTQNPFTQAPRVLDLLSIGIPNFNTDFWREPSQARTPRPFAAISPSGCRRWRSTHRPAPPTPDRSGRHGRRVDRHEDPGGHRPSRVSGSATAIMGRHPRRQSRMYSLREHRVSGDDPSDRVVRGGLASDRVVGLDLEGGGRELSVLGLQAGPTTGHLGEGKVLHANRMVWGMRRS